jgi:hypothetical protein
VLRVTPDASLPELPLADEGCGCRETAGGPWWLLAPLVGLARRRRLRSPA